MKKTYIFQNKTLNENGNSWMSDLIEDNYIFKSSLFTLTFIHDMTCSQENSSEYSWENSNPKGRWHCVIIIIIITLVVLAFELQVSHLLSRHATTWATPPVWHSSITQIVLTFQIPWKVLGDLSKCLWTTFWVPLL
jgi:p-aminobenzoyl-glutamate transporter AbgT